MPAAIIADKVSRSFGGTMAVNGLSFTVEEGEVFGVLGPNGAGKTTLVRLLNGVLTLTGGRAEICGIDVSVHGEEARKLTGVLTETPSLYERLTARENLTFFGTLYGVPPGMLQNRVEEILDLFQLTERGDDPVGEYSKGMKQRLALARAILHSPKILFLDEPTAGLDPEAAHRVHEMIRDLAGSGGRTVFLCTHNLNEAESLCSRVALINTGSLLAIGSIEDLAHRLWKGLSVEIDFLAPPSAGLIKAVSEIEGVLVDSVVDTTLILHVPGEETVPRVVVAAVMSGGLVRKVRPLEHTLEEIYFRIQDQRGSI